MSKSPFVAPFEALPQSLPIFPLPGAVLMPQAELPLNIFEPRYLNMVNDALHERNKDVLSDATVDADAITIVEIAMVAETFEKGVDSNSLLAVKGSEVAVDLETHFTERVEARLVAREAMPQQTLLRDAVQDAAGAATSEEKRIRATKYLDLL